MFLLKFVVPNEQKVANFWSEIQIKNWFSKIIIEVPYMFISRKMTEVKHMQEKVTINEWLLLFTVNFN